MPQRQAALKTAFAERLRYKGRLWVYLDPLGRQVVFDATRTHERDGPERFLADFRGQLQADVYTGYDALYRSGPITEIGCWAHGRRRFVDAFLADGSAARMVALTQQLYQVEHAAAEMTPGGRQALRQAQAIPLLAEIKTLREPPRPGGAQRVAASGPIRLRLVRRVPRALDRALAPAVRGTPQSAGP